MLSKIITKPLHLVRRINDWIRIRLTPGGKLVLAGTVISAIVGVDTNKAMAYQIFTFLLFLLLISVAWRFFFRPSLSVKRILPKFCSAAQPLIYRISVENESKKSQKSLYLLDSYFEVQTPGDPHFGRPYPAGMAEAENDRSSLLKAPISAARQGKLKETVLPELLPNSRREVKIEITPRQRGQIYFASIHIACPDPLGLFRAIVTFPIHQFILVLPKRYRLPDIQLAGSRKYHSGGVALASSVGDSEEFVALRDYRPGDPIRRIHWKSWAKTDRPIVKEYQDEFFVRHALVLDTFSPAESSPIFEEAVSIAASFAYAIQTQESLLDLIFVGLEAYCFTSGRGLARIDRIIEILASVRVCADKPFTQLPPKVFESAAGLSSCICIFLSWDEDREAFIDQLSALGIPLLVLVVAKEGTRPSADYPARENFHILEVDQIQQGLTRL